MASGYWILDIGLVLLSVSTSVAYTRCVPPQKKNCSAFPRRRDICPGLITFKLIRWFWSPENPSATVAKSSPTRLRYRGFRGWDTIYNIWCSDQNIITSDVRLKRYLVHTVLRLQNTVWFLALSVEKMFSVSCLSSLCTDSISTPTNPKLTSSSMSLNCNIMIHISGKKLYRLSKTSLRILSDPYSKFYPQWPRWPTPIARIRGINRQIAIQLEA